MSSWKRSYGYTIIEVLIVCIILSILFFMMTPVFFYPKKTEEIEKRLDIYHDSRKVNHAIELSIKLASGISFPSDKYIGKKEWFHQIIFRNYLQQTIVIFLNKKNELMELNYDQILNNKLMSWKRLGSNIDSFQVRRPTSNAIEIRITFKLPNKGKYRVSSFINLINVL